MSDDPAKARFVAIQLVRMSGVAIAVIGALTVGGRVDLPVEAGYVMLFVGVLEALFVPTLLARLWKSPPL